MWWPDMPFSTEVAPCCLYRHTSTIVRYKAFFYSSWYDRRSAVHCTHLPLLRLHWNVFECFTVSWVSALLFKPVWHMLPVIFVAACVSLLDLLGNCLNWLTCATFVPYCRYVCISIVGATPFALSDLAFRGLIFILETYFLAFDGILFFIYRGVLFARMTVSCFIEK